MDQSGQRSIVTIVLACLCCLGSLQAQQSDPMLVVRTKNQENSFHVGERIPLELSFTSFSSKRYEINLARYDRSGRMHSEQFDVSPRAGWADPLASYFSNGYAGGGMSTSAALSEKAAVISLDLNEWVRFDQPGDYDVTVNSSRVSLPGIQGSVALKSNSLKLHITPATPEWERARLNAALATLHSIPPAQGVTPDARTGAIADIRYLRSKEAIQVMAAGVRDDRQDLLYAYAFGLIGLPKHLRAEALRSLQVEIDDPEFPIAGWLLTVEANLLDTSTDTRNRVEADRFSDLAWQKCFAALAGKSGKARSVTAETLLNVAPLKLDPQAKVQLARVLSTTFMDLSPERQSADLLSHWDLLRSDAIEPTLQKLAELPLADPANNLSTVYATRELKATALLRWYDLNPAEASRVAVRQVGSAEPSLTEKDLVFFGDQKLPQFEALWAGALLQETSYTKETALAGLLARFGTGSALPSVVEKLSKNVGQWPCAPQGAALAYVVEFDPEQARGLLQRAVAARGKGQSACNHSVFQDVAVYTSGPVVADVAIEAVNDSDAQVAMGALIYLMYYGDKSAKEPILKRYLQWSDTWSGKSGALEAREPGDMAGNWEQRGLGENLATALIANQGWLADSELISQVLTRCVGEQMCTQLKRLIDSSAQPYRVRLYRSGRIENHTVAQYTEKSATLMQAKLAQFPVGTSFLLESVDSPSKEQKALEDQAQSIFRKAGMVLQVEHQH